MQIENLNKENFWDALQQECPDAVDLFCKWIDDYKKEVDWNHLFGPHIKFHDLPFDMQVGIIERFQFEMKNKTHNFYDIVAKQYVQEQKELFRKQQRDIMLHKSATQ